MSTSLVRLVDTPMYATYRYYATYRMYNPIYWNWKGRANAAWVAQYSNDPTDWIYPTQEIIDDDVYGT